MPDTFKFYGTQVTATSGTSVVSAVTGTRLINSIVVANRDSSSTAAVTVEALLDTVAFQLVPLATLSASESRQMLLASLPLQTDDDVQISVGTGNTVDVIVSVLERTA